MDPHTVDILAEAMGERPIRIRPLGGGCVAQVARADLANGRSVVVKRDGSPEARLDLEARMLRDLAATGTVRTPEIIHAEPRVLVLEYIPNDGVRSEAGGARFAESLAALHAETADGYGYPYDTLIGPLSQRNPWTENWACFYADSRIRPMAALALDRGGIGAHDFTRLARLCEHMTELVGPGPDRPALIHGDLWSGNVLWDGGEVVGVIDPGVYYADPETELAFIHLMGCFGSSFFDRYAEVAGSGPGLGGSRRELYTLYPLLVHAALFGGGYGASAIAVAGRLGF